MSIALFKAGEITKAAYDCAECGEHRVSFCIVASKADDLKLCDDCMLELAFALEHWRRDYEAR